MSDTNSTGTNARPLNASIAGIGEGIPDDALGQDEELPQPPSDADVADAARHFGVVLAENAAAMTTPVPGDEAVPGTPGTGENVCRACNGSGRVDGAVCPACDGTGIVIEGIGGG